MDRLLERVYYDQKSPAYLAGTPAVYREAKRRHNATTLRAVREWLSRQRVYTIHKPTRRRFRRQQTTGVGLHTHIQIDLVDMRALKYNNSHYGWILCAIDCFSRQARAAPLKTKRAADVLPALQRILESYANTNWVVYADQGTEFEADVRRWLQAAHIQFVQLLNSPHKASMVERWQRTLKQRLARHMTYTRTKRWVDVLQAVVDSYNHAHHRIIGRTPASITPENEEQVHRQQLQKHTAAPLFKIGQHVRIKVQKSVLDKGYTASYRERPEFVIAQRVPGRHPPAYRLSDEHGDALRGVFYEPELVNAGHETGPRLR